MPPSRRQTRYQLRLCHCWPPGLGQVLHLSECLFLKMMRYLDSGERKCSDAHKPLSRPPPAVSKKPGGLDDRPGLWPNRAINGASESFTSVISTLITAAVTLRTGWKTAQEPARAALLQLLVSEDSLCKDVQDAVSVRKKKQPDCSVLIRGLASAARGALRRLPHHPAEQPAGTWSRQLAQGARQGRPEISVSSLGSWREQRPPHEDPSPCRGDPRFLGLWGLEVLAGQQRVNPTLFHFVPGGVAVTSPRLGVTPHCLSP